MEKIKVFKIADLKDLEMQVALGDITYGRMVEILNDMAYFKYSKVKKLNEPAVSKSEDVEREALLLAYAKWRDDIVVHRRLKPEELVKEFLSKQ